MSERARSLIAVSVVSLRSPVRRAPSPAHATILLPAVPTILSNPCEGTSPVAKEWRLPRRRLLQNNCSARVEKARLPFTCRPTKLACSKRCVSPSFGL